MERAADLDGGMPGGVVTSDRFMLYSAVRLWRSVTFHGIVFPEGAIGVVVEIHPGDAYEVEMSDPAERVIVVAGVGLIHCAP